MHRLNKIVWILILLALTIILGILLFSGKVILYLSPRMINVVYFGFAVFFALLIYNIASMFSKEHDENHAVFKLENLLFIIPIVLFIFTTPDKNTVSALPTKNLNLTYANEISDLEENEQEYFSDTDEIQSDTPVISPTQQIGEPDFSRDEDEVKALENSEKEQNESQAQRTNEPSSYEIIDIADMEPCVTADNMDASETISSMAGEFREYMYKSLEEINGQEATLYGFVYKDDAFPQDTIAVSRMLISCCAADASLVGFHVKVEDVGKYEDDEWIVVTGVVMVGSMDYYEQHYEIPIITGGTVVKCESPEANQAYIYP